MWPFRNKGSQKGVSIILLVAGLALLAFPSVQIPNSFIFGVILAVISAIYLIDLR